MGDTSTITRLAQGSDYDFCRLMEALRNRQGVSARALSSAAGCSPSYVSKMERGEFLPTIDTFSRLVHSLGCTDLEIVFLVRLLRRSEIDFS